MSALRAASQSFAAYSTQSAQWRNSVLGTLDYCSGGREQPPADDGAPCLRIPMRRLDGDDLCDTWHGRAPLLEGQCGAIRYRHDGNVLFGALALPESLFAADAGKTPLQQAAESAYGQVFALIEALGYRHLLRCWNYFPAINACSFGLERYRQFNLGRRDAFVARGFAAAGNAPAACALGSAHGPLGVAFLAGRVKPLSVENPRQVRACDYPPQYGPRSPIFSRATLLQMRQSALLWLSGTASIVGHASLHAGDVDAQLDETVSNVSAVLAEANRAGGPAKFALGDLSYKVYVRRAVDLGRIRAGLQRLVGPSLKAVYLEADICREELLLEIEANARVALTPVPGVDD